MCLGVPATSALNAVEVEAGVLPLELRREELSIREGGKIMSKDNSQPIKELWNEWRDRGTGQLVPKSTRTLVNSYPCLVNSYLSQLVPKSTRTLVYL